MVKATNVGADDFILWFQQVSVDQTLDAVRKQGVMVNWFVRRLRNFKHDRPVWTGLRFRRGWPLAVGQLLCGKFSVVTGLVVRGVVGENSGTVEWTVIFDEVQLFYVSYVSGITGSRKNSPSTCHLCVPDAVHEHQFR